jgi:hypothetical protein
MRVPWFFATTPAPRPAVRPTRRRPGWWSRLAQRYIAWAERSHADARTRAPGH